MPKSRRLSIVIIALVSMGVLLLGNTMMDSGAGYAEIDDGTYEGISDAGMHPGLKVALTLTSGKITKVEVIEHDETEGISDPAIQEIPGAILAKGSPEVDVISGATLTSNAIIEAVNNAIAIASGQAPAIEYSEEEEEEEPVEEPVEIVEPDIESIADGTYEGVSDAGMHPGLKVAVKVEGGKILEVKVLSHDETDGISDPAIEEIPLAIVEANKTLVDFVSGATYTSDAIMEATRLALESAQ